MTEQTLPEGYHFVSKTGYAIIGFTPDEKRALLEGVTALGIHRLQMVEAASYSFAMVVRFALGLSAQGGKVLALVGDCLAGEVVAATVRHLANAHASVTVFTLGDTLSASLEAQLTPLRKMGVTFVTLSSLSDITPLSAALGDAHNLLLGLYDAPRTEEGLPALATLLNESQVPIHAVEAPLGVDTLTGKLTPHALFASSTLSLGVPLIGLAAGSDCAGRHYVCDISCTSELYGSEARDLTVLFTDQPVVQISVPTKEE
jgi:NAD(P)H-hydrate repair Nnr-like enzyme with NAD(P)H-hydrate epimerase domain